MSNPIANDTVPPVGATIVLLKGALIWVEDRATQTMAVAGTVGKFGEAAITADDKPGWLVYLEGGGHVFVSTEEAVEMSALLRA